MMFSRAGQWFKLIGHAFARMPTAKPVAGRAEQWFKFIGDTAVALMFPQMCSLCGLPVDSLDDGVTCRRCWDETPRLDRTSCCERCGWPAHVKQPRGAHSAGCPQCRDLVLTALRYAAPYEGACRQNILFLKDHPVVCGRIKEMLVQTLKQEAVLQAATLVVPVPLHPQRRRERGFNQAELVSRIVARVMGTALCRRALIRIKHTEQHRAGMDAIARAKSVSDAFALKHPHLIADQHVMLVDDVYTSGATLNACARILWQAGARSVVGFTIARVVSRSALPQRSAA